MPLLYFTARKFKVGREAKMKFHNIDFHELVFWGDVVRHHWHKALVAYRSAKRKTPKIIFKYRRYKIYKMALKREHMRRAQTAIFRTIEGEEMTLMRAINAGLHHPPRNFVFVGENASNKTDGRIGRFCIMPQGPYGDAWGAFRVGNALPSV